MRHTRGLRAGHPATYFALHRTGFFVPPALLRDAVGSYPTFSPLPDRKTVTRSPVWWFVFCDTLRRSRLDARRPHLPPPCGLGSCGVLPCGVRTFLSHAAKNIGATIWPRNQARSMSLPRRRKQASLAIPRHLAGNPLLFPPPATHVRLCQQRQKQNPQA